MHFRANEEIAMHVKLHAAADVTQEMIAAGVIGARNEIAVRGSVIETDALRTDARHPFHPNLLSKAPTINSVDVIQDRAKRFIAFVQVLAAPPGHLATYAQMMAQQKIHAEHGVQSTAHRLWSIAACGVRGRRRYQRAKPESDVSFGPKHLRRRRRHASH